MTDNNIEQSTFKQPQYHTRPLVDTINRVLNRALSVLGQLEGAAAPSEAQQPKSEQRIDPHRVLDLKHTKELDASIEGNQIAKPNWNHLPDKVLIRAMMELSGLEKIRKICPVNMVDVRKEDEGYSYLTEIGIFVQGQDANAVGGVVITAV